MSDYPAPFPIVKTAKLVKYVKGDVIKTVEELSQERSVFWNGRPNTVAFIMNMQARVVLMYLRRGAFRKLVRSENAVQENQVQL